MFDLPNTGKIGNTEGIQNESKNDPNFANEYLAVALEEADQPGGQQALLTRRFLQF